MRSFVRYIVVRGLYILNCVKALLHCASKGPRPLYPSFLPSTFAREKFNFFGFVMYTEKNCFQNALNQNQTL